MSIDRIEKNIQRIKQEFADISPERAPRAEPVQEKKGSSPVIIGAAVVVIIIALLVLAIFL